MKLHIELTDAQARYLEQQARIQGLSKSKMVAKLLGFTGPGVVPSGVTPFVSGKFHRLKSGVHTTVKDDIYRHHSAGGLVVYEIRVDPDDMQTILPEMRWYASRGYKIKYWGSYFYSQHGRWLCVYKRGEDLDLSPAFFAQLLEEYGDKSYGSNGSEKWPPVI